MSNLDTELKHKFWDWLFSMPSDEIGILNGMAIWVQYGALPIAPDKEFKNMVPGYDKMTEAEQQEYQREVYRTAIRTGKRIVELPLPPTKAKEKLPN